MNKKNKFVMPTLEVVKFLKSDIITGSGPETDKDGNVILPGGDDFE